MREWTKKVSVELFDWRERHNYSQEQAAEIIGTLLNKKTDERQIRRWESGESLPSPKTYLQMRKLLRDSSTSYGMMVDRDEVSEDELNALIEQSIARSRAKIAARANAQRRK